MPGCASAPDPEAKPRLAAPPTDVQPQIVERVCDLPLDLFDCPAEQAPGAESWHSRGGAIGLCSENTMTGDLCRQNLRAQREIYLARCYKPTSAKQVSGKP